MLWIWSTIWVNRDDPGRLVCSRHSLDNFDIAQVQGEVTRVTLDDVCSGRHESVIPRIRATRVKQQKSLWSGTHNE